jgi:GT2 family glycosyltransferase
MTFISVVIPTFRRTQKLKECLRSLVRQDVDMGSFEVIVVDDGGYLLNEKIDNEFKKKINLRIMSIPHSGLSCARNIGARNAGGKIIAFLDDDCLAEKNWLSTIMKAFGSNNELCLIGGKTYNLTNNIFDHITQFIYDCMEEYLKKERKEHFIGFHNAACRKETFHQLGGFDELFVRAEDRDLGSRFQKKGFLTESIEDMVVIHDRGMTFINFLITHFKHGIWAVRLKRKHKDDNDVLLPANFRFWAINKAADQKPVVFILIILSQFVTGVGFMLESSCKFIKDISVIFSRKSS